MGRLERLRRKKRHRKQRGGGGKEQGRPPRAAESDPEPPFLRGEDQETSCTNSCDDSLSLCGSSLSVYPSPLAAARTSHHQHQQHQQHGSCSAALAATDEMEVTRKLSCLNFSMLPPLESGHASLREQGREAEVLSDLELFSELTSTTHLDLLPTLSDREGAEVGAESHSHHRQARKRPSKRRTNRRSKRSRYTTTTNTRDPWANRHSAPLPIVGVVRTSSRETPSSPHGVVGAAGRGGMSRVRSFRRGRRGQEDDPLLCCFSDTSVVLDLDTPSMVATDNQDMEELEEEVENMLEATPPALEEEGTFSMQHMCDDPLPNESDLSSSTSDRYVSRIEVSYFTPPCFSLFYIVGVREMTRRAVWKAPSSPA